MPSSAGLTVEFSIRHGDYTRGNKRSEKENANANESTLGESEWVVSEWSVAPWAEKSSLTAFRITSRKFFLLHFFSSTQLQFIQLSSSSSESNPLNVERLIPRGYFTNGKLPLPCFALLSSLLQLHRTPVQCIPSTWWTFVVAPIIQNRGDLPVLAKRTSWKEKFKSLLIFTQVVEVLSLTLQKIQDITASPAGQPALNHLNTSKHLELFFLVSASIGMRDPIQLRFSLPPTFVWWTSYIPC